MASSDSVLLVSPYCTEWPFSPMWVEKGGLTDVCQPKASDPTPHGRLSRTERMCPHPRSPTSGHSASSDLSCHTSTPASTARAPLTSHHCPVLSLKEYNWGVGGVTHNTRKGECREHLNNLGTEFTSLLFALSLFLFSPPLPVGVSYSSAKHLLLLPALWKKRECFSSSVSLLDFFHGPVVGGRSEIAYHGQGPCSSTRRKSWRKESKSNTLLFHCWLCWGQHVVWWHQFTNQPSYFFTLLKATNP